MTTVKNIDAELEDLERREKEIQREKNRLKFAKEIEGAIEKRREQMAADIRAGEELVEYATKFLASMPKSQPWILRPGVITKTYTYGGYFGSDTYQEVFSEKANIPDAGIELKKQVGGMSLSWYIKFKQTAPNSGAYYAELDGPGSTYHKYKNPTQIAKRVNEYIHKLEQKQTSTDKIKNQTQQIYSNLQLRYPEATVRIQESGEYSDVFKRREWKSFPVVRVTFPNGFDITYRVYEDGYMSRTGLSIPESCTPLQFMDMISQFN